MFYLIIFLFISVILINGKVGWNDADTCFSVIFVGINIIVGVYSIQVSGIVRVPAPFKK